MNLLDDIIMDKIDKVVKVAVVIVSLVAVSLYFGNSVKEGMPQMSNIVNTYKESEELLETLVEKEQYFSGEDVVYGYTSYLLGISTSQLNTVCSEEEMKSLQDIAVSLTFEVSTTNEELEQMKDKEYALKRLGIENYTIIYDIVENKK